MLTRSAYGILVVVPGCCCCCARGMGTEVSMLAPAPLQEPPRVRVPDHLIGFWSRLCEEDPVGTVADTSTTAFWAQVRTHAAAARLTLLHTHVHGRSRHGGAGRLRVCGYPYPCRGSRLLRRGERRGLCGHGRDPQVVCWRHEREGECRHVEARDRLSPSDGCVCGAGIVCPLCVSVCVCV
jgi:hypothetical protein